MNRLAVISCVAAAGAVGVALAALAPAISAQPPPPPPSNPQVVNLVQGTKTGKFDVRFTPARIDATHVYPTYNFAVAPKFCSWSAGSGGAFRIQTYAPGGPYQVSLECMCNRTYTVSVASAPPDAYTRRSAWVNTAPVTVACQR